MSMGALTLRIAVMATLASVAIIGFQANGLRAFSRSGDDATSSAEPTILTGTAVPTATALDDVPPPPTDPRLVPFHGLLDGVTDFEDIAQNRPYAALAEWVHELKDDEAAKIIRTDLDYTRLTRWPNRSRGELVQVSGLLRALEAVKLAPGAGPPGVVNAWRGWLVEPGGEEAMVFDLIGDPPDAGEDDLVRVEGAFLKVVRYESGNYHPVKDAKGDPVLDEHGNVARTNLRDAPFLIARRAWRLSEQEMESEKPFRYDYLAVMLIAIVGALLLLQRHRTASEMALLEAKREELARRLEERKGKGNTGNAAGEAP
jgi:hypothetical protein